MKLGELVDLVNDPEIEIHDVRIHRRERETYGKITPAFERKVTVYHAGNVSLNGKLGDILVGPDPYGDEISAFVEVPHTPYREAKPIFDALDER